MTETVVTALITGGVTLLVCLLTNHYQQSRVMAILQVKLEELARQVDKHNSVIERTYRLEESVALHEEKIKVANHRIDDHMKQLWKLVDVKSLVTLAMTGAMIALLFAPVQPNPEAQSLFCTAYGAIITYFFTKRDEKDQKNQKDQEGDTP